MSEHYWQRFTEALRRVVTESAELCNLYHQEYITTDLLLLSLLKERDNDTQKTSWNIIEKMGVKVEHLRNLVIENIIVGNSSVKPTSSLTPEAKRVIDKAHDYARELNNQYIGTEHLLLALCADCSKDSILYDIGLNDVKKMLSIIKQHQAEIQPTKQPAGGAKSSEVKDSESILVEYSRNLTAMARAGDIDPVIGRQDEIDRVIQTLSRKNKSNVCLTGDPGVGKTAIVEGLALAISEGEVPKELIDSQIFALDLGMLVAGTKYRGEFEERMKGIIAECQKRKHEIILFIDEIHTMIGAGSAEGSLDAGNMLKPALARGEIRVIGATTVSEYRKYFESDEALSRRFQAIQIEEPSVEDTIEILYGLRTKYEEHHNVMVSNEAIEAAVHLSNRYIKDKYQPDKSLDLIDEGCSKEKLSKTFIPREIRDLRSMMKSLNANISRLDIDDPECIVLEEQFDTLLQKEEKLLKEWEERLQQDEIPLVTESTIASIIESWTGIPVTSIKAFEADKLLHMEEILSERVIGQKEAISSVVRAIKRSRSGIRNPNRPIASMIFMGPTGVGKTELCKVLAGHLFDNPGAFIRFDMSEFMDAHTSSKLIGAPPGYVGYGEGGQLTEQVRRTPYSVVLLDEIEKAHTDIFNVLLQILEDGHATDGQGRKINFQNCIIIMTSNVGVKPIDSKPSSVGFRQEDVKDTETMYQTTKKSMMIELKNTFRPEFLNRLDDVVVFHHLTMDLISEIVKNMVDDLNSRSSTSGVQVELSQDIQEKIVKEGFDINMGARPLRRAFQTMIEDPLSDFILVNEIDKTNKVKLLLSLTESGEITFKEIPEKLDNQE